jgi:hypothetical protein
MGDIEKAKREIRYAKSAADDRRWDLLETRIQGIEAALEGVSDAERSPVLAEIAPLRAMMAKAVREEQAARIEREIKRNLSNAEDGSESQLEKAVNRLAAPDAQECLAADVIQGLRNEIARIQAKLGIPVTPPPAATQAQATPVASPPPQPKPPGAAPQPAAASATLSDEARAIESDVARTLMFAAEDVERDPDRAESKIERAVTRLDSPEAQQHLPAELMARLRAQVAELQAKTEAGRNAEKVARLEEQLSRFMGSSESHVDQRPWMAESTLKLAVQRIESGDAKQTLPAPTLERWRSEIARMQARIARTMRESALERALPILQDLEQRIASKFFDDHQPAYRVLGDLDYEKARVRGALERLPSDDADVRAIEARLAAVDERIAEACAALDAEQARARVNEAWQLEQKAISGWDEEQHAGGADVEMPKTAIALRRLSQFLVDKELARISAAHAADGAVQSPFAEAERIRTAAAEKLDAAYQAALAVLERGERPANRLDLEEPGRIAARARSDLEGTPYAEPNAVRADALYERWQAEIAADRAKREAKYRELSALADAAWRSIAAAIKAEDGFDPADSQSRGKTVRFNGIRNRIGWDFSGRYDLAMWVGDVPVVGNYDERVNAAVNDACERAGLPLDDHTDWDVVFVIGGPGKIKQRFRVTVRDRNQREIGTIEEWRPVDCLMCTVTALRAGPVAVGPSSS